MVYHNSAFINKFYECVKKRLMCRKADATTSVALGKTSEKNQRQRCYSFALKNDHMKKG